MTPVLMTMVALAAFVAARTTFHRLSLHYDTGFYVSNHTVVTGRFCYAQGWNARYAGCCKVLPEWFLSRAYLAARRNAAGGDARKIGCAYARLFRFRLSLYQCATAVIVGLLAQQVSGGDTGLYYAGLVAFCLLAVEPTSGNYDECAESFEVLPQAAAMLLLSIGVNERSDWLIGAAACLWTVDACFIKLSSLISLAVLFTIAVAMHPPALMEAVAGVTLAGILFLCWRRANGVSVRATMRALWGHEKSFSRQSRNVDIVHRFIEKARCAGRVMIRQPVVPLLALIGLATSGSSQTLIIAYLTAVTAAYVVQAADCRYYLIPLMPPMAVLAGFGAVWLLGSGVFGVAAVLALLFLWLFVNVVRPRRVSDRSLDGWCWRGFRPDSEVVRNEMLAREAEPIARLVAGRSMFVYGPLTQAYVLVSTAYDIALISPDHHLDDMDPGWQAELNRRLVRDPPAFVLDTNRCFAAAVARNRLGLDYRMVWASGTDLLLYELKKRTQTECGFESAETFAATARSTVEEERRLGGVIESEPIVDAVHARLKALLDEVCRKGHRRLAVYGAGRFTTRHAEVYRTSPVPIAVVLDDAADELGGRFLDWPVRKPNDVTSADFDAVIISTDRFTGPMRRRVREQWRGTVTTYSLS